MSLGMHVFLNTKLIIYFYKINGQIILKILIYIYIYIYTKAVVIIGKVVDLLNLHNLNQYMKPHFVE